MNEQTEKGKFIVKLLDDFPNAYSRVLARIAHEREPKLFPSYESARSLIRYYRDAIGEGSRKKVSEHKRPRVFSPELWNPYGLPETDADDYPPFHIKNKRVLVLPDLHVPYHDIRAITVALKEGEKREINAVLLNGDFFDFHGGSRFTRDPRLRDMGREIDAGAELIRKIYDIFKCPIYFKKGNHDERWENYLKVHAPPVINTPEFELNNLLNSRLDFHLQTIHRQVIYAGKLAIIHGHEYGGYGGGMAASPAKWLFMKTKKSAMKSHSHRESSFTTKNIEGGIITTWSTGCLCGLWPEYAQLNEWVHGFSVVDFDDEGQFNVNNFRIHNGKLYR